VLIIRRDKLCQHNLWLLSVAVSCAHDTATDTCKGKAVPLQAWSGPEGSRKLRLLDFMTTAQDGGKVVSLTHRPQEIYLVLISVRD
jgi:hypothetical protein